MAGFSLNQIAPWIGSLDACGFLGRRVVIHTGAENATLEELKRRGYETHDASVLHEPGNPVFGMDRQEPANIAVNRYYYVWHFLSRVATPPRYLVSVDVRDVVFQSNPSVWLEQHLEGKRLVAGFESLVFEDEPWGSATLREAFGPHVWDAYRRRVICNSGTIAGEFRTLVDLCLQIFLVSPGHRVHYSDQAAMNVILGSAAYQDITRFAESEDGWACQAGTIANPTYRARTPCRLLAPEPHFDGECVRTASGKKFALLHQYDRVPEWNAYFKPKYGSLVIPNYVEEKPVRASDGPRGLVRRALRKVRSLSTPR